MWSPLPIATANSCRCWSMKSGATFLRADIETPEGVVVVTRHAQRLGQERGFTLNSRAAAGEEYPVYVSAPAAEVVDRASNFCDKLLEHRGERIVDPHRLGAVRRARHRKRGRQRRWGRLGIGGRRLNCRVAKRVIGSGRSRGRRIVAKRIVGRKLLSGARRGRRKGGGHRVRCGGLRNLCRGELCISASALLTVRASAMAFVNISPPIGTWRGINSFPSL